MNRLDPKSLVTAAALALISACSPPATPAPEIAPETTRSTPQGEIVGFVTPDGAHAWLGIPFAQPPVGELRWRAPRPAGPWPGTREALTFGNSCPQFPGFSQDADVPEGHPIGDEDCLYLNVYAPKWGPDAVPSGDARVPVMVWIHGGGNSVGDARIYDGSLLANAGPVIVVTIHYRLGVLGWFTHPALRAGEGPADASGNYGTLDAIAALAWVRDHISSFGGDPGRVTVFGESAGGTDTHAMLLSPRAAGLFHRAISQSGTSHTTPVHEAENYTDDTTPGAAYSSGEILLHLVQNDGRATDRESAKKVIAAMSAEELAADLRARSLPDLFSFFGSLLLGGMYPSPELIEDGYVLPARSAVEAYEAGEYNHVPAILGTNRDEVKLFAMSGSHHLAHMGGIPLWVKNRDMFDAASDWGTKRWKLMGVDDPARGMRKHQKEVWAYRFDWDEERSPMGWDLPGILGAAHAFEIPFVFGWLTFGPATSLVFDPANAETDRALSEAMMSYWTAFAHDGDPGRGRSGTLPPWPAWNPSPGGTKMLILDTSNDGGIRPSPDEVHMASILAGIRKDPRLKTQRDRCEAFGDVSRFGPEIDPADYAQNTSGDCSDYPAEGYPWLD